MTVTQKFIAEKVGVSQKTVSLFFNGDRRIAPKTAEAIQKIAREYGYIPNLAAQSIKTKCFKRVALIMGIQQHVGGIIHPHLMTYIRYAAEELAKSGYLMVLETLKFDLESRTLPNKPEFFKTLSVDAIIGIPGRYIPSEVDSLIDEIGVPVIWLNRYPVPQDLPNINFDEVNNGRLVGEYLAEKGYRNVVWLGPDFTHNVEIHYSFEDRYNGLAQACSAHGINLRSCFRRIGEPLVSMNGDFLSETKLPEAVICYNFDYAETLSYFMMQKGLRQGIDLEVIKFASLWEGYFGASRYYTRLVLPEAELSVNGVQFLLSSLQGKPDSGLLESLSGKLVPRIVE